MESEGRNIWGRAQNSERWKIFRLGPASHNILRVNDGVPYAGGRATFITSTNAPLDKVALDLTRLYPGAVSAVRTGTLLPAGGYILNDHISGFVRGTVVKWQMLTPARVKAIEGNSILLAQKDSEGEEATLRLTTADRYVRWEARDVSARVASRATCGPDRGTCRHPGTRRGGAEARVDGRGAAEADG